jgi:ribosomal protein S18 acetylase RimI-like enzyme
VSVTAVGESVLRRITDAADADVGVCEAMWVEYGDWATAEYVGRFGAIVPADHEGFHATLPVVLSARGRLYLVRADGEPVATGVLKPLDDDTGEIKRLYVRPVARGRGIARMVVEQLLSDARSIGYRRVRLDTLVFMTEALALYRSLGFRPIDAYTDGETARYGIEDQSVYLELGF